MCAGNGQGGVAWSSSAQAMRSARGSSRVLTLTTLTLSLTLTLRVSLVTELGHHGLRAVHAMHTPCTCTRTCHAHACSG